MSKRRWVASKLLAVLGGAVLALAVWVPRASAQLIFSNSSYANRYVCGVSAFGNLFPGTMILTPNGTGTYVSGTLEVPVSADGGTFSPTLPPTGNFCQWNLDVAGSSYSVNSKGIGVEVLSWSVPTPNTNNPMCATALSAATPTFVMSNTIVLRAYLATPTGRSITTEITSNNFLNLATTGYGTCVK